MTKEEKLNTLYIGAATIGQLEAGAKDEDADVRRAAVGPPQRDYRHA
jgi:hypothetical protein